MKHYLYTLYTVYTEVSGNPSKTQWPEIWDSQWINRWVRILE